MAYALIRHKVEDFGRWKPVFDEDGENRKAIGSKGYQLFRGADDPNEVFVLFEVDGLEGIRKYGQSEELREKMQEAGVAERPDFYLLEEVEQRRE